jgi:2-phosphoglycolate phosphatase
VVISEQKRAVLFDLDGTLIDSFQGIHEALTHAMSTLGFEPLPFDVVRRMVGHGLEALLSRAFQVDLQSEIVARALPIYRASYADIAVSSARPFAYAGTLLAALHARGVKLGIASNKPSYFSKQIIKGLGWDAFFASVMGPDLVSAPKPDPAMLRALCGELGVSVKDTLYVGDMTVDLETARAADMDVVLVASGSMSAGELCIAGASNVIASLSDLAIS